jgi:hypothetical protein
VHGIPQYFLPSDIDEGDDFWDGGVNKKLQFHWISIEIGLGSSRLVFLYLRICLYED